MKYLYGFLFSFLICSKISAGIIYTDLNFHQHNPLATDWIKTVDVNKDGVADLTFSGNFLFHDLEVQPETNATLCYENQVNTLNFFQLGDSINEALNYMAGSFLLVHMDTFHMPSNALTYIGFELINESSGSVNYGWISIKFDIFHGIFYLYEAALNDESGKSIAAGQTGVSIPENLLNQIQIVSGPGGVFLNNLPPGFRGVISLFDLNGRLLARKEISAADANIAVNSGTITGILALISGNDKLVRKILFK